MVAVSILGLSCLHFVCSSAPSKLSVCEKSKIWKHLFLLLCCVIKIAPIVLLHLGLIKYSMHWNNHSNHSIFLNYDLILYNHSKPKIIIWLQRRKKEDFLRINILNPKCTCFLVYLIFQEVHLLKISISTVC